MSATIRPARFPDDLGTVRALFVEYIEGLGLDLTHQDVDGELAALPGSYVPPRGAFLLAELEGRPVGIGALRPLPDGSAELKRMYLRPEARGLGLGRRMAEALIGAARAAAAVSAVCQAPKAMPSCAIITSPISRPSGR